ncbi:MAG: hypothetical protein M3173_04215 [Chloroflexota bacterium]|nr:hypothetical protein [Chloroflexota bacterium]
MASWRDNASSQAQQDLDGLLDAALGFAQQQLEARGKFFPYAAAVGTDGQAEMIAARPDPDDEQPRSADVIDACVAALVSQRDYIRAGAVVADVRLADQNSDAIRVDLEHAEGHVLTVLLPYTKKKLRRDVDYGQIRAQAGTRRIWT